MTHPFSFKKYTFKSYAMTPYSFKNIHLRAMQ